MSAIKVSGTGCCLVDILYNDINFREDKLRKYMSIKRGDGGLSPGHLVFREEFEEFCKKTFDTALNEITGGRKPDKINIGGPSIVSLINITQMADINQCEVRFYGRGGNDEPGRFLIESLRKTKVHLSDFRLIDKATPSTVVLSDPGYENGHGERMFINSIAAAWEYGHEDLPGDFFEADLTVFGGTGLVPGIHDNMTSLLRKAKKKGCRTIVNTVFDFRNEKRNPGQRWPLGESDESYSLTDLLIADREEALRLSGTESIDSALKFFIGKRTASVIITDGSNEITAWSDGSFFAEKGMFRLPVSEKITEELKYNREGDTTGCGDNFAGGVMASLINQIKAGNKMPELREACMRGIVSGGYTCFYLGGTYFEEVPGEKQKKIEPYYAAFREQIKG